MNIRLYEGYVPHHDQYLFHASGKRFLCAAAGARGGKTMCAAAEFARRIGADSNAGKGNKVSGTGRGRRPRLHYWVVAPTEALLAEPLRFLQAVIPPEAIEKAYGSDNMLWLHNDILIELKSADNPRHLVAAGLHGLWIDEAARVKPDAWSGQLRQRLSDHQGWALFSTTPLGRNWLYEEIVSKSGVDPEYETIQWTTADNPYVPLAEIDAAYRQLPRRYFAREYMASFEAFMGTVFDEWNEKIHVMSPAAFDREFPTNGRPVSSIFKQVVAGVDWGWNAPGAIVVVGDLGNGRYIVLDESYEPQRILLDQHHAGTTWVREAQRLKAKWNIKMFYCDPSLQQNLDAFQSQNLPVTNADNEVSYGIRRCSEVMHPDSGTSRLRVLSTCKNLIRELRDYQWAQNRGSDSFTDRPAPGQSDHAIDAWRYALVEASRYEKQDGNRIADDVRGVRRGPPR
jgi:hypothetical protein